MNPKPKAAIPAVGGARPKRGKGSAVLIRVTQDTRNALEREAQRTGRSLSQTAEIWLDRAIGGRATYLERLGGDTPWAAALEKLAEIARAVTELVPDKNMAAWALRSACAQAIPAALPLPPLPSDWRETHEQAEAVWNACRRVLDALDDKDASDPVFRRATEPLLGPGGLLGDKIVADRLAYVLIRPNPFNAIAAGAGPSQGVCDALEQLRAAGNTAATEIEQALEVARAYVARTNKRDKEITQAMDEGRAIAQKLLEAPQ